MKAGKLWAGLGDAGSRKGKAAVVCAANVMLVLDESGRCTQYTPNFGNYRESAGHCALRSKAGGEVFTATVDGVAIELLVDGDAIYSTQLSKMPGSLAMLILPRPKLRGIDPARYRLRCGGVRATTQVCT